MVEIMIKTNLKELLKEKKKTKYWLAKQTGLGPQTVDKLVNNRTTAIKFSTLELLCTLLECTPNDLFIITPTDQIAEEERTW